MELNASPHNDAARHRANTRGSIQVAFAAPTFSILGLFRLLSAIVGASGLGRKQSKRAQFSNFFRKTVLSAQVRAAFISIYIGM